MKLLKKLSALGMLSAVFSLVFSASAAAHVVVRPAEVTTASFQTFTVGVPNEKDTPTASVKLLLPEGLQHVSPTQKPGWQVELGFDDDTMSDGPPISITWSGGEVAVGLRDDFTFSAKVPAEATELIWKAHQTYSDGTVVAWDSTDGDGGHGEGAGPASSTQVMNMTAQDSAIKNIEKDTAAAKADARRSLYVAVVGVVLALAGIALATRKKS